MPSITNDPARSGIAVNFAVAAHSATFTPAPLAFVPPSIVGKVLASWGLLLNAQRAGCGQVNLTSGVALAFPVDE